MDKGYAEVAQRGGKANGPEKNGPMLSGALTAEKQIKTAK